MDSHDASHYANFLDSTEYLLGKSKSRLGPRLSVFSIRDTPQIPANSELSPAARIAPGQRLAERIAGLTLLRSLGVWTFRREVLPREFHRAFMSEKRVSPQRRFDARELFTISTQSSDKETLGDRVASLHSYRLADSLPGGHKMYLGMSSGKVMTHPRPQLEHHAGVQFELSALLPERASAARQRRADDRGKAQPD